MPKTIEIKEARAQYALPLDEAQLAQGPLILERQGTPIAAIISFVEYERYRNWREQQKRETMHSAQWQKFERERAAYQRLKFQLLQTHRGQFVAIHEGKAVDVDRDRRALVKRVVERYGNEPVYIQLVAEELPTFEVPSPEREFHASL